MTRAEALRKLLAIGSLYRDEIFTAMGGDPFDVSDAISELRRAGELQPVRENWIRQVYRLTDEARARAFGSPA
jgi:hypothetical protein